MRQGDEENDDNEEVDEVTEQEENAPSPEDFEKTFFPRTPISSGAAHPQNGMPSTDVLKEMYRTKSAAIRYLHSLGYKPLQIARHLGIKPQHARNVCVSPLKRGPNEDWRPGAEATRNWQPQPENTQIHTPATPHTKKEDNDDDNDV